MQYCYFDSPLGKLLLAGSEAGLELISFIKNKSSGIALPTSWSLAPRAFAKPCKQLDEYFNGKRKKFDLPFILNGTPFQKCVLKQVAKIVYGSTSSYSQIAEQIGNPKAVRAVGMANATNRLPIIIPCHRVIGKNGNLTGFAGGIEMKKSLLKLEGFA